MFKINKKGLIYAPSGVNSWDDNSMHTPQPFLINDEIIRIYACIRDKEGIGRIGYIDVEAKNPKNIVKTPKEPVLDIGRPGMFDDNGLLLGDLIRVEDKIYMYYVGFELVKKAKHTCYTGLAISTDNGETFTRYSEAPVMDRSEEGLFGRCIHTVIPENGVFRTWYAVVYGWEYFNDKPYPAYNIRYTESKDGIHFDTEGEVIVDCSDREYRIGRPKVRKLKDGKYEMRYTFDTYKKEYISGYAESQDGLNWTRYDKMAGLVKSEEGWDSEMACYPAIIETKYGTYMFYNGNGMGRTGVGYAEVIDG